MFYDELQRSFSQTRIGKSHLYLQRVGHFGMGMGGDGASELIRWLHFLFTHPDREQTRQIVDEFYAEMDRLAAQTPASLHNQGIDMDKRREDIASSNILLNILVPALG